jgi:hypothetical protein
VFFHQPLFNANTVFFGIDGDGLQIYYTSLFHVDHDNALLFQEAMNYPYKESVFFTSCQPVITVFIKLLGLNYFTIGILNLTMLLSLPVSVWIIYFILREFKVQYLVAALGAVAIGYLSPQVYRMTSHYTLAYCFAIPAIIYLMIKFYQCPSFKKSIIIAALVFFMASTHMYFFLFFAVIISAVWAAFFFNHPFKRTRILFIKHFGIQLIIPLGILQFIIFVLNNSNDRTNHPWGFFEYMSNWTGVFYPFGKYYEYLFKNNNLESIPVSSEGISYVGLCSTILSLILALKVMRDILNLDYKNIFKFSSFPVLNFLIVSGIVTLFYSFGWPFIFGYEKIVYNLGFLQQMRALGRFAWLFFYIINIALVVLVWHLPQRLNKSYLKWPLISFVLFVLSYDAYMNVLNYNDTLNNRIAELSDSQNKLPENQWMNKVNSSEFQAILPFPYFHVGSENVSVEPKHNSVRYPYIVSLKTGLPIVAVLSSRISLSHTFENLKLIIEPNGQIPQLLVDFKNKKDFLVIVQNHMVESEIEKRLIALSEPLLETPNFNLLRLPYKKLEDYFSEFYENKGNEIAKSRMFAFDKYCSTDSLGGFLVMDYTGNPEKGFVTKGSIKGKASNYLTIFEDVTSVQSKDSTYILSFWINHFNQDMYPRGTVAIDEQVNGSPNTLVYASLKDCFKQINGNWALIECRFKRKDPNSRLKVVVWSTELINNEEYEFDDMLLRSSSANVYRDFGNFLLVNNYIYHRD